jgi:hypothetical protein
MRRLVIPVLVLLVLVPSAFAAGPSRAQIRGFLLRSPGVAPGIKDTIREGRFSAGLDRIVRGDLTGDGQPDEVVTVFSGGTAGDIAFYVLSGEGSGMHAIKSSNREYKIGVQIVAGQLQVTRPLYAANDPNCCPEHLEITTYRYDGHRLVSSARERVKTPK